MLIERLHYFGHVLSRLSVNLATGGRLNPRGTQTFFFGEIVERCEVNDDERVWRMAATAVLG
jgi:hypothetical protein